MASVRANPYEAKQEARRQRLLAASTRAAMEAEQLHKRATGMASVIPLGQPILVGHHSEGRDRRYRGRIHETYRRSFEAPSQAEQLRQRAASVGTAGVSSDAPEAIAKLRTKLASMETLQSRMKAGNTIVRDRKLTDAEKIAELVKLGLKEANAAKALTPDFAGRVGFPDYALKNNGAEIRRVRARIEALEAAQQAPGRGPVQGEWVGHRGGARREPSRHPLRGHPRRRGPRPAQGARVPVVADPAGMGPDAEQRRLVRRPCGVGPLMRR